MLKGLAHCFCSARLEILSKGCLTTALADSTGAGPISHLCFPTQDKEMQVNYTRTQALLTKFSRNASVHALSVLI